MKVLVVDDDDGLRELMVFALESQLGATAFEARSASEAISIVETNPDLSCIVSDYSMPEGSGGTFYLYLQERPELAKIPFILISNQTPHDFPEFKGKPKIDYLLKPFQLAALVKQVRAVSLHPDKKAGIMPEYCQIRTSTLVRLGVTQSDLYLKLSDEKHIKVMKKGDPFLPADEARFAEKHCDSLYLKRTDSLAFLKAFTKDIKALLKTETLTEETAFEIPRQVHEAIHAANQAIGFTPEVQQLTRECVALTVKTITKNPHLSEWLKKLQVNKESYISSHSILQAYLACGVASLMGWTSETTFYSLCYAAFLHDITLTNQEIAQFRSLADVLVARERFSEREVQEFQTHPEDAAKIVRSAKSIPQDVDVIVVQHHERPDGSGFPKGLMDKELHPLAVAFIVAHDLTRFITHHGTEWRIADFLNEASNQFKTGLGKRIVKEMGRKSREGGSPGMPI